MASLQRLVLSASSFVPASLLWRGTFAVFALVVGLVAKSVDYEFGTVLGYFSYLALFVALPGGVVMYAVNRGPVSWSVLLALGLPTGFAVEIFTFLGLAALHAKWLFVWTPLGWAALAVWLQLSRGVWPVRRRWSANHAGLCLALALAFLAATLAAVSQMFVESPLADGLPTRAIFHDWVYLVSRAGVIKNHWPLEDPSLSGTPLQYHYFMMVHAAAVSATTGIEITAVLLRLIFVPLGAVLVAQMYVLGRAVTRTPWGGVLAAFLTVAVSEVSFAPSYGDPLFLGLFARWLFVSPTFYFGLIFAGALLIAIARIARGSRLTLGHAGWLLLLGSAGTGAKGTMPPVLLCALGLWAGWRCWRERRVPYRLVGCAFILLLGFLVVYWPTMSAWKTGDAGWRPFHVFQLTGFWKQHAANWAQWLAHWLPRSAAGLLASLTCAAVVFAGTCGVRLLAIPFLVWGDLEKRDSLLVGWLGAFFAASAGMGMLMELNSFGELYLILMMRLPMSVLTAAFFVAVGRRIFAWSRELKLHPSTASASPFAVHPATAGWRSPRVRAVCARSMVGGATLVFGCALFIQTSLWWTRNRTGLMEWWKTPSHLQPDGYMRELQEALLWARENTEPNAVFVANAFTPENMKKDHWGALDRTLMGVHFYYSALSERRLWFEGPAYIMDTTRARIRANMASNFFYRSQPLDPRLVSAGPSYILVDHTLQDGAHVTLPNMNRVFSNQRLDIYRLSELAAGDD